MAASVEGRRLRVVVLGAGGQLGTDLVRVCTEAGDDVVAATRAHVDIGDRDAVYGAITSTAPDVVINAAAFTAVDACETEVERAHHLNSVAVGWIADASRRAGAHLVHLSTDYVFDGTKVGPYQEWDVPNPQSVYGASKLAGEVAVAAHAPGACVVRTSWVCGEHGANMVKTVLGLRDSPELRFVDDQRGCPTFTTDLAPAVRRLAVGRHAGTFHVTNDGAVSWFEFVRDVLEVAGADPSIVQPITTAELDPPRPARRPANSVLEGTALRLSGLPGLPHYRGALEQLVGRLLG